MNTILQVINDTGGILFLTIIFINLLLLAGWIIDRYTLKQLQEQVRYNDRKEFRLMWNGNFAQGVATELIGAASTALLFGIVLVFFQQYQDIENDKADLILQMGSPDHAFAIEAVRIADQKKWLIDGTLEEAYLGNANLERAQLRNANLEGADLSLANLKGVNLTWANLSGANLSGVNLEGASLTKANLSGADLWGVNLENVIWQVEIGNITVTATLPDSTQWTSETDVRHFTDENHPEYNTTVAKINTIRKEMGLHPFQGRR